VRRTAKEIAESAGARAEITIGAETSYPVTYNDPKLTARMLPTMQRVAGDHLQEAPPLLGAEDFSFYGQKIPALFVWVGVRKPGASTDEYAPNHSPRFKVDEDGLELGVRTLANLTVDYMIGSADTGAAK
jgi:metal-dependent amidase/aminoacylase/carboxypeptidase family protein